MLQIGDRAGCTPTSSTQSAWHSWQCALSPALRSNAGATMQLPGLVQLCGPVVLRRLRVNPSDVSGYICTGNYYPLQSATSTRKVTVVKHHSLEIKRDHMSCLGYATRSHFIHRRYSHGIRLSPGLAVRSPAVLRGHVNSPQLAAPEYPRRICRRQHPVPLQQSHRLHAGIGTALVVSAAVEVGCQCPSSGQVRQEFSGPGNYFRLRGLGIAVGTRRSRHCSTVK